VAVRRGGNQRVQVLHIVYGADVVLGDVGVAPRQADARAAAVQREHADETAFLRFLGKQIGMAFGQRFKRAVKPREQRVGKFPKIKFG